MPFIVMDSVLNFRIVISNLLLFSDASDWIWWLTSWCFVMGGRHLAGRRWSLRSRRRLRVWCQKYQRQLSLSEGVLSSWSSSMNLKLHSLRVVRSYQHRVIFWFCPCLCLVGTWFAWAISTCKTLRPVPVMDLNLVGTAVICGAFWWYSFCHHLCFILSNGMEDHLIR